MWFTKTLTLITAAFGLSSAAPSSLEARQTPGSLQQVTSFGSNPSNTGFYIYVPNNLAASPGIVVAIHYCTGSASAYYNGSPYKTLSEQYGFIVIYPSSPYSGTCWDVSSKSALTNGGGGDSESIKNMVTWTIDKYAADTSKVFVTGSSSGAMMTNVMAATYPSLFAAGIAYSGVPAGCFMSAANGVDAWNSSCAQGQVINTPAVWAQVVKDMYPSYTGTYPKMQIYHGSADTTLLPQNYQETTKQWAGVFGYDYANPASTAANTPVSGYTKTTWGPKLQGIYAQGVGHTVPIRGDDDMAFFGFSGATTVTTAGTGSSSSSAAPVASSSSAASSGGATVAKWGQCGGSGYSGATTCVSGTTCVKMNDYYSQCQ